jgi:micrococcal nuclease
MYEYNATVVRWVDGDTVDLIIDLGFTLAFKHRCRVWGVNTPERGNPGYAEATSFCRSMAPENSKIVVKTYRDTADKYGRYLVNILIGGTSLSELLVEAKLAVPYFGGTKL